MLFSLRRFSSTFQKFFNYSRSPDSNIQGQYSALRDEISQTNSDFDLKTLWFTLNNFFKTVKDRGDIWDQLSDKLTNDQVSVQSGDYSALLWIMNRFSDNETELFNYALGQLDLKALNKRELLLTMEGVQDEEISLEQIYDINSCIAEHKGTYNPAELKKLSITMRVINKTHKLLSYQSYETLDSDTLRQLDKLPLRNLAAIISALPNVWNYHKSPLFVESEQAIIDKLHELKFNPESLPILMNAYTRLFEHEKFPGLFDEFANALTADMRKYWKNFRQAVTLGHALGKLEKYDSVMEEMFTQLNWPTHDPKSLGVLLFAFIRRGIKVEEASQLAVRHQNKFPELPLKKIAYSLFTQLPQSHKIWKQFEKARLVEYKSKDYAFLSTNELVMKEVRPGVYKLPFN